MNTGNDEDVAVDMAKLMAMLEAKNISKEEAQEIIQDSTSGVKSDTDPKNQDPVMDEPTKTKAGSKE